MSISAIIFIGFGLSMDAFTVSITDGMLLKKVRIKDAVKIGLFFGGFQALMPLIGWTCGVYFQNYITKIDHWIAFSLLTIIGGKMIYDTLKDEGCKDIDYKNILDNKSLLVLAIATSIDALAVGTSFAFLKVDIVESVIIVGIITFIICFIGVIIGKKFGSLIKNNSQIIGGIVLIIIGIRILMEHTNILNNLNL